MATAMIAGLTSQGVTSGQITVVAPTESTRQRLSARFHIRVQAVPDAAFADCDVVILAVKPQHLGEAARGLRPHLSGQLIVSLVAAVRLTALQRMLGKSRIVRAMPNVGVCIGQGMTGLLAAPSVDEADRKVITTLAASVGRCLWVDSDAQLDTVTALSGSGPAYLFYLIEAMEDAAVALGLNRFQGQELAIETLLGSARLARESTESCTTLRDNVTSKGGVTEAAIGILDDQGTKAAFIRAIRAAADRSQAMGALFE